MRSAGKATRTVVPIPTSLSISSLAPCSSKTREWRPAALSRPLRLAYVAPMNPLLKLVIELGPLAVFFLANARYGIFTATGAFMAALALALAASILLERRVPVIPLVTGIVVMIFGGLTLYLNDETFIKLKPTIVNSLFAAILFGGLIMGRALVKPLLGRIYPMADEGWRRLSFRWACFFVVMALINEVVWRNFSTDTWVAFKVFGFLPLTVLFSLTQIPLMSRYRLDEDAA